MKKPSRRNTASSNEGALLGAISAISSLTAAPGSPLQHHRRHQQQQQPQLSKLLLPNRRGTAGSSTGLRLRHAMTTISLLTVALCVATFMILMAASTSKEAVDNIHGIQQKHSDPNRHDNKHSPLAHALSSSRRNLSQLLPEDEGAMSSSSSSSSQRKATSAMKTTTTAAAKDDDEQVMKQQFLRQLRENRNAEMETNKNNNVESSSKPQEEKHKDGGAKQAQSQHGDAKQQQQQPRKGDATKKKVGAEKMIHVKEERAGGKSKVAFSVQGKMVDRKNLSHVHIGQQVITLVKDDASSNITTTLDETDINTESDELDDNNNGKMGIDKMIHLLPSVNGTKLVTEADIGRKINSVIDTMDHIATLKRRYGRGVKRPLQPYVPIDARTQMEETLANMEGNVQEEGDESPEQQQQQQDDGRPLNDPLMALWNITTNLTSVDFYPQSPYLGVLIDAGRHYFPIVWLKNLLRYLHAMNFNFVHFRLTDDQTFNINLTSYPHLASPVTYNNPDHLVYSKEELLDLVQFAEGLNITIMPEINVPGHAGSWAGIPGLIVNCPEFICQKGYGVPINVTHPDLREIMTNILREVREVFYTSPFLHLGGDEVHMAQPCFNELGAQLFDYGPFENMLKEVLLDLNISNDKVLRWEMTGQQIEGRAGKMIHFWESDPGQRMNATGPYFVSNGLYFDTNGRDRAYDVYIKTRKQLYLDWSPYLQAIVVGTFELNPDFWFQRNVIGRLLGVAMGASGTDYNDMQYFSETYTRYCHQLQIDPKVCKYAGEPIFDQGQYYGNWQAAWQVWKRGICDRLTYPTQVRTMMPTYNWRQQMLEQVNREFWSNFANEPKFDKNGTLVRNRIRPAAPKFDFLTRPNITALIQPIRRHAIQHTGVILDLVNSHPAITQLEFIVNQLTLLGFNLIQLRLADDYGYAMAIPISQGNRLAFKNANMGGGSISYDHMSLARIVDYAERQGDIKIMPEISVSTNAGGWNKVGFGLACPTVICDKGRGIANDISDPDFVPVVGSVIRDLRKIFSSDFLHLGDDQRDESIACFNESHKYTHFNTFERKLNALLELEGVNPQHVLRWENRERKRYRGRAGKVTHFRTMPKNTTKPIGSGSSHPRPDKGEIFFANIDIYEGTAWDIYQSTRDLVLWNPLGLMAEVRVVVAWSARHTLGRLLAFAMGLSTSLPVWSNETQFRGNFTELCQEMARIIPDSIETDDCIWFGNTENQHWQVEVETDAARQQACNALTFLQTKRHVRTNITAY